ncbi:MULTISPECIES: GGDEF domain-containing protein [Pseudomonas]|jgi:diguanylate cyclase (GGDEF)-like protein|uniref:diguanylate cyclase n=1 Tax=Ectopseudomonas oleovorans TaxID=301 RepID=A0A3D9EMC5_ECTOL|nr:MULTISPECIES: GGDEF domain-containing protein [Pseudomonas]KIZ51352.1 diguanylate cyclase [Pseudomonas oryzihabitans]MDU4056625.1 GGDEF domain-containing protein [Pseudomonas oryzihabitans]RED04339.1 diguanylate cyclase (GGDEF)-like protein [Pseudomonas oleovorans]
MTASVRRCSPAEAGPDLFEQEAGVLQAARALYGADDADAERYRAALGDLTLHFERLMRETRRLIARSDRAEREMNALNQQLQTLSQQLEYRATHDALTGMLNRGAVIDQAGQALRQRGGAMIVLDIDHFKRINDEFGHPAGDRVIQAIARCLQELVQAPAIVGRVGGEEFTVLLPTLARDEALAMTERLRLRIAREKTGTAPVTASFGLSLNLPGTDFELAYGLADAALYRAKRAGRNQVVLAD